MSEDKTKKEEVENLDFLDGAKEIVNDRFSMDDVSIPFLRILQALSPACTEGTGEYNPNARPGMFMNSLTGKLYGRNIKLIPLKYERTWLEWKPNRGGFVGRHLPETLVVDKTDFRTWKLPTGNEISDTIAFYCLIADHIEDGPIILSLSSSGIKHAKNWHTFILTNRAPDGKKAKFFSTVWELETVLNKGDNGSWYTIGSGNATKIKASRWITKDEYVNYISASIDAVEQTKAIDYAGSEEKLLPDNTSKQVDYSKH